MLPQVMQPADNVILHRRASPAFLLLTPRERERILAKFRVLARLPHERWSEKRVRRAGPESPVYFFYPTPELVVYFEPEPDRRFFVVDIMSAGLVEQLAQADKESSPQP
jgi:hypothetical protein